MKSNNDISRRDLLGTATATLAATAVPRHVLGGADFVAPSDKLTVEMASAGEALPREGLVFAGDIWKILAGFRCESPRILPEKKMIEFTRPSEPPKDISDRSESNWISAFKAGEQAPGSFLKAGAVTETILLGGVALRARQRFVYDAGKMVITNLPEANKYLTREYREGWEL